MSDASKKLPSWDAQTSSLGENCDRVNSSLGRVSEEPLEGVLE